MHTADKMRWFTKETAKIPCRKYTFWWCFRMDSLLIFIFPLHPDYTNFRQIFFLSSSPRERTSTRPWTHLMGMTYEKQGWDACFCCRGSFLGVWKWVSHIGCEMLWSAAAPPAQLLSIFLWVCEFWCHFRLDSRGKMRVSIINGSWDSARCLPASRLELILGEASSRYLGQVYP